MKTFLLMGLRGAGKTTTGAMLAEQLGRSFVDLDERVMRDLGVPSVTEIFQRLGEPAFRKGEARALESVLREDTGAIVSLGGGTPTAPGAEGMIRKVQSAGEAIVVYLHAPHEYLSERLRETGVGDRPRLVDGDIEEEMRAVYDARDPLYRALADRIVNAARPIEDVVRDAVISVESLEG